MQTLDVRPMAPRVRHETIFDRLDALAIGETLRLVNDHDPAPLRYQLDATRPGQFRWVYVEQLKNGTQKEYYDLYPVKTKYRSRTKANFSIDR